MIDPDDYMWPDETTNERRQEKITRAKIEENIRLWAKHTKKLFDARDDQDRIKVLVRSADKKRTFGHVLITLNAQKIAVELETGVDSFYWPHNYQINILEEDQDSSVAVNTLRTESFSGSGNTCQAKEWMIDIYEDESGSGFMGVLIDPPELWSFLRDRQFRRDQEITPKRGMDLTVDELRALKGIKTHGKKHPSGEQDHAVENLRAFQLVEDRDDPKKPLKLTAKGVEFFEDAEYKRI